MSRFAPLAILSLCVVTGTVVWWAEPFRSPPSDPPAAETALESDLPTSPPAQPETILPTAKGEGENLAEAKPASRPRALIEETTYDFGVLPRFTKAEHLFTIRNEGDAPLTLKQGPSSCSCTTLGLDASEVPPGESADIKLEWTLKFKEGPFRQTAVLYTNDPDHKEITLTVQGLTETRLGLSEPSVAFSSLLPGEEAVRELFLYSQTWNRLDDVAFEVKADIPGMEIEILPATAEEITEQEVRAARKIRIRLPADLEPGRHVGQVVFTAQPPLSATQKETTGNFAEAATATLAVEARIKAPGVKFFSPKIDGFGRIKWGAINGTKGSEVLKLNFRVDQGDTPWSATKIDSYPKSLDVKVVPLDEKVGLFQLQIQVPPGTPPGNFYGQQIGRIVLHSDHPLFPRIPTQRLGILLEFHVE